MYKDQKINYKILRTHDSGWFSTQIDFSKLENELNRLGQHGWDVVTALDINYSNGGTKEVALLLKRYE